MPSPRLLADMLGLAFWIDQRAGRTLICRLDATKRGLSVPGWTPLDDGTGSYRAASKEEAQLWELLMRYVPLAHDEPDTGRVLTDAEVYYCIASELEIGFDVDTQPVQYSHVCYPYATNLGALCQTEHLWFQGRGFGQRRADGQRHRADDRVSCDTCVRLLELRMEKRQ